MHLYRPVVHIEAMGHASQLNLHSVTQSTPFNVPPSFKHSDAMNVILAFVLPQQEMHSSITLQYIAGRLQDTRAMTYPTASSHCTSKETE